MTDREYLDSYDVAFCGGVIYEVPVSVCVSLDSDFLPGCAG